MDYSSIVADHISVGVTKVVVITYVVGSTKLHVYGLVDGYSGDFINVRLGEIVYVVVKNDDGTVAGTVNVFALSDQVWTINLQYVLHIVPLRNPEYHYVAKPSETIVVQCNGRFQEFHNSPMHITVDYIRKA